jgi:hypothetical protein
MRVRVSLSRRRVRLLCIRVCGAAIAALAPVAAQAQTINLSTNATINVPVIGTTTISVPVNVLGNVVNLNVNVSGAPGGVNLQPTSVTLPVTVNGNTVNLSLNVSPGLVPILGGQTISLPIAITLPPELLPAVVNSTASIIANRRNDTLLGLDLGLERQVDLLTGSGTDATSVWGVLFVGADYRVSPDLLIGALASFDDAQQDLNGLAGKARSTGWMVGPYATMRLTNNLFFQARAAWGKSTHELGFDGSPEDRFDADRWLVRGTLIGQWRWGPWQLRPRISVGYIEETQETYLNSLGVVVPGTKGGVGAG